MLYPPVQSPDEEVSFLSVLQRTVSYNLALLGKEVQAFTTSGFAPITKARGKHAPHSVNTPGAVLCTPKCEGVDLMLAEEVLVEARGRG